MIRISLCIPGMLFLGLFLAAPGATASECGILRLQKARSAGTDVVSNECKEPEILAVKSVLQLGPGSRAWLESTAGVSRSAAKFQIICQNESPTPIKIKVASPFLPWIQPEGIINCNAWAAGRLQCKESGSGRTTLICAIVLKKMFVATYEIQRNASVIMRGGEPDKGRALTDHEANQLASAMENGINPKLDLCGSLFIQETAIAWTITSTGQAANALPAENSHDDQFALCALKVIEAHAFPPLSSDVQIHMSFK
jgi:hypothetical protein